MKIENILMIQALHRTELLFCSSYIIYFKHPSFYFTNGSSKSAQVFTAYNLREGRIRTHNDALATLYLPLLQK